MKKLRLYVFLLYMLILVITIAIYIIAPDIIVLHFNSGKPDYYGEKISLFIFFLITLLVGELGIIYFKINRKKNNMINFPELILNEGKFIQILFIIVLVFISAMIHQLFP
ncbi:DUF1648 domain-containing protein [Streptococcus parauberis]|uniref:DUF1648 domain-containing protein n=1 Tax=Streptococcus parauberis TaxID=1348 RepID=UPI00055C003D|nr:DUF1648 domain-containing protein [Streptococcus parauberis]